jgi:CBS domain-containing protein
VDVRAFLADHPPFDALSEAELDRVVASVQIEHFAPGTVILQQAGAPATHLFVIRRGEAEIVDDGRVIDEVGEGDVFGMWSLLDQVAPTATVRAFEDTLCYLIDADVADEVLRSRAGIAFVTASVRRRIAAVDETLKAEVDLVRYREVGALVRRPPVTCDPNTAVADAAELMARERVSSLLIPSADGAVGILTDRDLRTRVVAERRSGDTPIRDVMTPRAETVPADTMVGEVLLRMLEGGFHHFPIADAGGRVTGVVTDTDLMGIGRNTPFALKSAIDAPETAKRSRRDRRAPDVPPWWTRARSGRRGSHHRVLDRRGHARLSSSGWPSTERHRPHGPGWRSAAPPDRSRPSEPTRTMPWRSRATPIRPTRRWRPWPSS